ncbi:MAG: helix-turn-helix domain-containing protein [Bacteroidota bacterium]
MLSHHLLFFFSALGVFNGLLLSACLLAAHPRRISTVLTGSLLLLFCIRVGVSCLHFFTEATPWILVQLGLTAHLLIGPTLYTTTRTLLDRPDRWGDVNRWHILLGLAIVLLGGTLYPFEAHVLVWDHRIRYGIHALVAIYVLATALRLYRRRANESHEAMSQAWLVFGCAVGVMLGFVVSLYTNYIVGPLWFSIVFYGVGAAVWWTKRRAQSLPQAKPVAYADTKISSPEAEVLIARLKQLLTQEAPYRDPTLKLAGLAKSIGLTPHKLSQLLNDNMGQSFATFINTYRVEEAQRLMLDAPMLTMEAIGYEAGFSSRSSFYAAFKKHTGLTPAAYRGQQVSPES